MLFRKNSLLVVALAAAAVLVGTAGVAQAALVSYFALDEASGATVASDTSGVNTNDLTAYAYGTGAVAPTAGAAGVIGDAWQFYGGLTAVSSLQRVTGTNFPAFTDLTLSAWVYIGDGAPIKTDGTGFTPGLIRAKYSSTVSPGMRDLFTLQYTNPSTSYSYAYPIAGRISSTTTTGTQVNSPGAKYPAGDYLAPGWCMETYVYSLSGTGTARYQAIYRNGVYVTSNQSSISGTSADSNAALCISGIKNEYLSTTGYIDDAGIWNEFLASEKIKSLYTAPTTFTADAAAGFYGQKDMQALFNLYDTDAHTPIAINGKTWQYMATMPTGYNPGDSWISGGAYYVQLGAGDGISTIPEPSTLLLLASGLIGLLAYAWRKRK